MIEFSDGTVFNHSFDYLDDPNTPRYRYCMKHKMYAVYDAKVEAYLQPFFMRTRGEAMRAFQTTVSDPSTHFFLSPADFTLFEIGEYDDSTGRITELQTQENLGNALQFKKDEITQKLQQIQQEA